MATIKVKFRASTVEGSEGCVFYQILHDRVPRQISTPYKIMSSEWDCKRGVVMLPKDPARRQHISSIRERIGRDLERLSRIVRQLEDAGVRYSCDDVVAKFTEYSARLSLTGYMEELVAQLNQNNRKATAGHYKSAILSIKRFLASRNQSDIMLDGITAETMLAYEAYLKDTGITRNTSSAYMRTLRAAYNRAVDDGIIGQQSPFRRVYTGVEKTAKRSVPLATIARIKALDLSGESKLDFARDMFLLSFYFRGMSFVDMAFLRKSDLNAGFLTYHRHKTGQRLIIKWTSEMQGILDKYPANETDYLLPIIRRPGLNEYYVYRNAQSRINKALKAVGERVGVSIRLTHYAARHSWASGAQAAGVSLKVISEGMGHDNELTTQIYLASLDTSEIDLANDKILRALK